MHIAKYSYLKEEPSYKIVLNADDKCFVSDSHTPPGDVNTKGIRFDLANKLIEQIIDICKQITPIDTTVKTGEALEKKKLEMSETKDPHP